MLTWQHDQFLKAKLDVIVAAALFMDLTSLHELAHLRGGTVGSPDVIENEAKLWKDCIQ